MSKELIAAAELELLLSKREQWAPFGLLGMAQYVNGRIAQLRAQAAQESAAQVPVSASAGEHPTPSTPDAADRVAGWKMVPVEPTEEMLKRGFEAFMAAHDPIFRKNEPCGFIYKLMLAAAPPAPETKPRSRMTMHRTV